MPQPQRAMQKVRILELASVLAGPLAGTALSERGAIVTKVECPPHGDVTRSWKMPNESAQLNQSAYYESANGDKEVFWKDFRTREGKAWLEDALSRHDIVIENFKKSDLDRFGLTPEDLAKRHPHLIHVRLIGFKNAPERLAYDVVVQAETGFMHMNGHAENPPTRMPVALMDVLASQQIISAVYEGLIERSAGNQGIFAEVSLEASGLSALANQATNWLINGADVSRNGSAHPNIAPYGDLLQCANGWLVLAVGNERQYAGLCEVLNCKELTRDQRFHTNKLRVKNRGELISLLSEKAKNQEKVSLEEALRDAGVPAGVVKCLSEVFSAGTFGEEHTILNRSGQKRVKAVAYQMRFL
jgi:crotonobetainyl-CoA:carnitine CoA-transferase CaiB-like acyl-CoA transferase